MRQLLTLAFIPLTFFCTCAQSFPNTLTPAIIANTDLFMAELTVLNLYNEKSCDTINQAIHKIDGLVAYATSNIEGTCTVYMDSIETVHPVIKAIREAGYELDKTYSFGGPGLTCDIAPQEDSTQSSEEIEIFVIEESVEHFREAFNTHQDKYRIITIPNPACLACVNGQRFINELFQESFPAAHNLKGFTIWTSINGWGEVSDMERLAPETADPRMTQYWDEKMIVGKLFKKPLGLAKNYLTAWDVYLIYAPGIRWTDVHPPAPLYWMHQLTKDAGIRPEQMLDNIAFRNRLETYLTKE